MSLTSVIRYFRAIDTSSSTGAGKTGLAFGDFTAKYITEGGTLTSLTTETITTLGTYQAPTSSAHIRIKELNSADPSKGIYEVHFHNTQMTDTGKHLWLFVTASGALVQPLEVDLMPYYADVRELLGTAWLTPAVAGTPDVNAKQVGGQTASAAGTITFPGTLASTTNITAGTITTVTNLTNAPTNGDFTSTMKAATLARVTLVDTVTTYTGNTPQTGDSFARIGANGAGLTAVDDATLVAIAALNNIAAADVWAVATRVLTAGTNIVLAKGVGVTGFNDLDAAGVRTAVGLTSANLDTQIDSLPTNAELATALAAADDAILTAIAALNNLSQANIRTAIGLATANLDTQLDALPTADENTAAVFAQAIESGVSFLQAQRAIAAKSAGNISGAGTGEETVYAMGNSGTARMVATVDTTGNITAWVLTL